MKYKRGDQTSKLEDLKPVKVELVTPDGDAETPWAKQGDGEIVLQNHAVAFYPDLSWGSVFKTSGSIVRLPEEYPEYLTLHPDAWDHYLDAGTIDSSGNQIKPLKVS